MAGMACTSEDGNEAILVISSLAPDNELPTQALCPICAAPYIVALLAQLTGVDVAPYVEYVLTDDAGIVEAEADEPTDEAEAEADPTPPTKAAGRSRQTSGAAPTDTYAEPTEPTDEVVATSPAE